MKFSHFFTSPVSPQPGQIWTPPSDKCLKFECVKIGTQFIVIEAKLVCPPFNKEDCIPVSLI